MNKKELRKLSKNQLIELLFEERQKRELLENRLNEIESKLKAFDNPHTPSSKKNKRSKPPKNNGGNRFPGKPKGGNGSGINMPPADKTEEHTLNNCPHCLNILGLSKRTTVHKQLDLPPKLAICTEHIVHYYHCNCCNKEIPAANINGRYGPRARAFTASLKEKGLSCQEIALTMREMGFKSFCAATVILIITFFTALLKPIHSRLEKGILESEYLCADETGLRKDGKNGNVWGLFTKGIVLLFAEMSRGKIIANKLLNRYMGLVITDGYIAYNDVILRQRCWSHLIREFKELSKKHNEAKILENRMKKLYEELKVYEDIIPGEKVKKYFRFQLGDIITCLESQKWGRKLATLIKNGGDDWFTALNYTGVPFHNNLAEQGLRRIVMHRKRMGCYRTEVGKNWINVCLSVMQTWRMQNKNVLANLIHLQRN